MIGFSDSEDPVQSNNFKVTQTDKDRLNDFGKLMRSRGTENLVQVLNPDLIVRFLFGTKLPPYLFLLNVCVRSISVVRDVDLSHVLMLPTAFSFS